MRSARDLTVALYGIMTVPEGRPVPGVVPQNFNICEKKVSHLLIKVNPHVLNRFISPHISEGTYHATAIPSA
jgi:hypothetical protein